MARRNRIKHYHRGSGIYRAKPHPAVIVLWVVAVAALVFVGMNVYGPVRSFLENNMNLGGYRSEPPPESSVAEQSLPEVAPPAPEPPPKSVPTGLRTVYLPTATALDSDALGAFLSSLEGSDVNSVMVDIKDATGAVLFDTKNADAVLWEAVSATPVPLKSLADQLAGLDLHLVVRMSAYLDPTAARGGRENAIFYQDSEMLWLDNFADAGGKPWLNPYAAGSQQYLTDLATEAVDAGAVLVVLENLQFPVGSGGNATFGADATGTRSEALGGFVSELSAQLEEQGARLAVTIPALALTQEYESGIRYGGSPLDSSGSNVVLSASADQLAGALETVREALPGDGVVIPLILGDALTTEQLAEQVAAVQAEEYILFAADGVYALQ